MAKTFYAAVRWTPGDLQAVRPYWSLTKCAKWLAKNEGKLQDALIERGWEVLHDLSYEDRTVYDIVKEGSGMVALFQPKTSTTNCNG